MSEEIKKDDSVALLELSPRQLGLLRHILSVEYAKKCDIRYEDTDKDQASIRRSIYCDGGIDMLQYLLNFDEKSLAEAEQAKQLAMQTQMGNQPIDNLTF